jgi:OOP family OmpA-OmpF porin
MKGYLPVAVFSMSLVVLPFSVQAADFNESGWYGAASLGVSSYGNSQDDENDLESELAAQSIQSTATVNDNPAGFMLGLGYQFNHYLAVEGSYVDLGQATANVAVTSPAVVSIEEDAQATGESLDLLGLLPVSERVRLFGRLGVFNYSLDETLSSSVPVPLTNPSSSGTTFDWGVGVDIRFTQLLGLRAGLTQYHNVGDGSTTGKQDIDLVYAELLLHFQ